MFKHSKLLRLSIVSILIFQVFFGPIFLNWSHFPTAQAAEESEKSDIENKAEVEAQIQRFSDQILGYSEATRNPLDTFGLFDQYTTTPKYFFLSNQISLPHLGVKLISSEQSRPVYLNEQRFYSIAENRAPLPSLFFQGTRLVVFRTPVEMIGFYKNYLVFLERGSREQNPPQNSKGKVEYLSFVDLKKYSSLIGKESVPIFTIPVGVDSDVKSARVDGDLLVLEDAQGKTVSKLSEKVFEQYSLVQQIALNLSASLTDPDSYEDIKPLMDSLVENFYKSTLVDPATAPLQLELQKDFFEKLKSTFENKSNSGKSNFHDELIRSAQFKESVAQMGQSLEARRKLTNRLHFLFTKLISTPNDSAPLKLKQALAMMAMGLRKQTDDANWQIREGLTQILFNRRVQLGAAVTASAILGLAYPEQFHHFLYEGINASREAIGMVFGHVRGVVESSAALMHHASTTTFSGFKPYVFYQAYLEGDRAERFFVGISAWMATALSVVGLPVVTVSSWKLIYDLKKMNLPGLVDLIEKNNSLSKGIAEYFGVRNKAFLKRQQEVLKKYLKAQTDSFAEQAKHRGQEISTTFTPEQEAEVDALIAKADQENSNWIERFVSKVSDWLPLKKNENEKKGQELSEAQIYNFRTALTSFLFSYATLTGSFESLTRFWNGFTIFRRVVWSPTLWLSQIFYPNLINVALGDGASRGLVFPTKRNGGMDNEVAVAKRVALKLFMSQRIDQLEAYEKQMIGLEKLILEKATVQAFEALTLRLKNQEGYLQNVLKIGRIKSITDPKLYELSFKERTYFRVYLESLYEFAMQDFLKNQKEGQSVVLTEHEADQLVLQARERADQSARFTADSFFQSFKAFTTGTTVNLKHRILKNIDPQNNPTMERIQVVLEMLQKPDSMPRAVRSTLSSMIMAKTFGLAMMLFGLANVHGGVMQPLHDEMFGADSYFYLGRLPFLGMIGSLVTGIFASTWVKLQVDSQHRSEFGEVPEGEDAKKGVFRWYLKQTFQNPENKWWSNQKTQMRIAWRNIKPATVLIALQSLSSLGRFDLDGYFVGYLIFFMNLLTGVNTKLEQGVEFASYYYLKYFPRELRGHPKVMQWLSHRQQRLRLVFEAYEKTFVDIQETILGNYARMTFNGNSEAFSRIWFFGYTATEFATLILEKAKNSVIGKAPGMHQTVSACEVLLTNNYRAWQKVEAPKDLKK